MTKLMPRLALLLILLSSQLAWAQMPPLSGGDSKPVVAENCQHHADQRAMQDKVSSNAHAGCQHDGQCHCAHFSASPLLPSSGVLLSPTPNSHFFLSAVVDSATATDPFKPWRPPSAL